MNEKYVVWMNKLDNKYDVFVERLCPYNGQLVIKDGDSEILREDVTISYDAIFGPDMADIDTWENRCVELVETHESLFRK